VHAERGMRLEPPGNKTSADNFNKLFLSKKKIRSRFREMTVTKVMKKLRETGEAQQSGCSIAGDIIQVPQFLS
jgi:hypothetical protein